MKRVAAFTLLLLQNFSACGAVIDEPPDSFATVTEPTTVQSTENETDMETSEATAATAKSTQTTTAEYGPSTTPIRSTGGVVALSFSVGFQVNTHGYVDGEGSAGAVLVRTRQELDAFYAADRDGNKSSYQAALRKYNGAFFEGKALLLVNRQEPSGSNRLQVTGVMRLGGSLDVSITRTVPEVGTADMARWVIGIELKKDALPAGEIPVSVQYH